MRFKTHRSVFKNRPNLNFSFFGFFRSHVAPFTLLAPQGARSRGMPGAHSMRVGGWQFARSKKSNIRPK
jgi:hypothetical protein